MSFTLGCSINLRMIMALSPKRLVCCADIVGFSNKLENFPTPEKIQKYREIIQSVKSACHWVQHPIGEDPQFSLKRTNFHWFSDFFILFSNDIYIDSPPNENHEISNAIAERINKFLQSAKILFLRFLWLGFPLSGGIDFGEFVFDQDENIVIGEALIHAVKLSKNHEWAGIAITPTCSKILSQYTKVREYLTSYPVPTKKNTKDHLDVIDWPKDPSLKNIPNVKDYISNQFKKYCADLDDGAERKLANTIKFLESRGAT